MNPFHPTALCALKQRALAPLSDSRSSEPSGGSTFATELAAFHARIDAQEKALSDEFQKLRAADRRIAEIEIDNIFLSSGIDAFRSIKDAV